jgi:hypothetical protein
MSFCKVYYSQLIPSVNTLTPKLVISLQSVISIKKIPLPCLTAEEGTHSRFCSFMDAASNQEPGKPFVNMDWP